MRISILTFSCCNPAMRSEDQRYLEKVREALVKAKIEAQVGIVVASEAASVLSPETAGKVRHLFDRYGLAMMPAMLIDDELVLYGGVPTMDKISEVLETFGGAQGHMGSGTEKETKTGNGVRK
ncbi:MAG TPA: hypothetical protein VGK23_12245 [Methanomassiliicoccales archaeon]|jgi:Mg/Co/Ni transporter MgtE